LNRLINLPFGSQTPFTAEIWYVNKTVKRDLKWGTQGAIQVIDPVYNFPVSVRAFGRWGIRIEDSRKFVTQIVGTLHTADSAKIEEYFIGEIVQRLSDALAKFFTELNISAFQASAKINELSTFVGKDISAEFARFGIEIVNFNVERISIPPEELQKFQDILGRKMEIDQISKSQVGQAYTTMRTFDTLEKAASNEGGATGAMLAGGLGAGLGLGAGMQAGQKIGEAMNPMPQASAANDPIVKLQKLKQMLDGGLITKEDFEAKKKQLLDNF
jgi:membrane protease subunit (stomatin/prohibitin family)